jgi:hypothetical protein
MPSRPRVTFTTLYIPADESMKSVKKAFQIVEEHGTVVVRCVSDKQNATPFTILLGCQRFIPRSIEFARKGTK